MIYLDYQATTPTDPRVLEVMLPYFTEKFGNPHAAAYAAGWEASAVIEKARRQIASSIGADNPKEVIFTSGGTESNNLALKGIFHSYHATKNHIITCSTEHPSVLETCHSLEKEGAEVTYLPVDKDGMIDLTVLEGAISEKTVLVSIMAVNNEIGVIQNLKEIGAICRKKNVFFHTDAAQAVGKIPLNVDEMGIDLLTISGHKCYASKGIGALYIRAKNPRIRLKALFHGGGQERGLRAGTLATPLCVGLGEACRIALKEMTQESERLIEMRDAFLTKLRDNLDGISINGTLENRTAGNLNISFEGIDSASFLSDLKDIALSAGSACASGSLKNSHVLTAIGLDKDLFRAAIRVGFGRFTTSEELQEAADLMIEAVTKQRAMKDALNRTHVRQSSCQCCSSSHCGTD
ncbi:MAG: cysteine desulfurase family protein [Alphaproteobacteria bacterium]